MKGRRLFGEAVEEQVVVGGLDSDVAQVTYADLGPDGGVWIVDTMNVRVRRYVAMSGLEAEWGRQGERPAELTQPTVLKVSPAGDIAVAVVGLSRITVASSEGELLHEIGSDGMRTEIGSDARRRLYVLAVHPLEGAVKILRYDIG